LCIFFLSFIPPKRDISPRPKGLKPLQEKLTGFVHGIVVDPTKFTVAETPVEAGRLKRERVEPDAVRACSLPQVSSRQFGIPRFWARWSSGKDMP
jgi:hypothetical protein